MAAKSQKVRTHFLVALTLVVIVFGVTQLLRLYQHQQRRTRFRRTERELEQYLEQALLEEEAQVRDVARAGRGRLSRDAAALVVQIHALIERADGVTSPGTSRQVRSAFERIQRNFGRLKAGQPAVFPRGERFLRAYYDPVDGAFRPYSICLPQHYSESLSYAAIVMLRPAREAELTARRLPCYASAISVQPMPSDGGDCSPLDGTSLTAVLREVRQLYPVDPARVYLVDYAAGHAGAWVAAGRRPDAFAGVVALGSEPDSAAGQAALPLPSAQEHAELLEFLRARLDPASYAENLVHHPVVVARSAGSAGAQGPAVPPMVARLRAMGAEVEYLQFPGPLPAWAGEYALARALAQQPPAGPRDLRFVTSALRHGAAWWVRVEGLDHPARFARVRSRAEGSRLRVETENVQALRIIGELLPEGVEKLEVGGLELTAGDLFLARGEDGWQRAQPAGLRKREGLSGPFADVLQDRFLPVYGTAADSELLNELSRQEAERFADHWARTHGGRPHVRSDAELTPEEARRFNLLLFGGPRGNAVAARVMADLPVSLEGGAVVLGGRRYEGTDVGVMFCHPNPEHPDRMVALIAGTTPGALYQAHDRFGARLWPGSAEAYHWFDYAVYDARTAGPESFPIVGFFDNRWRLRSPDHVGGGAAAWTAQRAARERTAPQRFPEFSSAAEAEGEDVCLCDVRPARIKQPAGAVGFDRSFLGRPIPAEGDGTARGLGVAPPSELSFRLDGAFAKFSGRVAVLSGGQAVFEVRGDGRSISTIGPLRPLAEEGRQADIRASVRGVRLLTLRCQPAKGEGTVGTSCVWAEPTVRRPSTP